MNRLAAFLVLVAIALPAAAIEPRTEHTFQLSDGEAPPIATLEDVAWLAGRWEGEAFGKTFEEVWNPPSAGSMVGFFKLIDGDEVDFYELLTISDVDGRLHLRVKHFSRDFIAWEEKDGFVDFKLVAIEEGAIHFSGISFYAKGPDAIEAYIVMRQGEEISEQKLIYRRVRPAGD